MEKLPGERAKELAISLLNDGWYRLLGHARQREWERNVNLGDIENVMKNGSIRAEAEWNERYEEWRYKMAGVDCEGVELAVVFAFEDGPELVIVTVI